MEEDGEGDGISVYVVSMLHVHTHTRTHIFCFIAVAELSSIEAFHMLPAPVCGGCGLGEVAHMHIVY